MTSIQFQKDASYHLATENGGRREIKIPAGTVQRDLTEAQAHRWIRRGVAIKIPDDMTPAAPPAPPPAPIETPAAPPAPPAPGDTLLHSSVPPAPPAPPAPVETVTARPPRRPIGDEGNA